MNFTRTDQERLNAQLERMSLRNEEYNEASTVLEGGMSFEDRKAQEIVDRSVTLLDGHYQVKLPFRQDPLPPRPTRQSPSDREEINGVELEDAEGSSIT